MTTSSQAPFHQRLSFNLISISLICAMLVLGKDIILPLLFAILLANILLPITNYLLKKGWHKALSISLPLFLSVIVGAGIIYFMSSQMMDFVDDLPRLKYRFSDLYQAFQQWFGRSTHITITKQNQYVDEAFANLKENSSGFLGATFSSLTGILVYVVLVPLYTFLILFYRSTIKLFLVNVFRDGSGKKVTDVLAESTSIAQKYLVGLFIETVLVFTLNTIGFLILGIDYALFLALLAALLNLIPYVGILVANVICIVITLISGDNYTDALWVGVILGVVQFLDNNFGMPLIVGNQVRINALVTIVGVLIGGALCGIPGMFLAIPGLAVLKVIFDKVPELKPWGLLLGDNNPRILGKSKSDDTEPEKKAKA